MSRIIWTALDVFYSKPIQPRHCSSMTQRESKELLISVAFIYTCVYSCVFVHICISLFLTTAMCILITIFFIISRCTEQEDEENYMKFYKIELLIEYKWKSQVQIFQVMEEKGMLYNSIHQNCRRGRVIFDSSVRDYLFAIHFME